MTSKSLKSSKSLKYNICYDGLGARKSGTHTRKQFLSIMDKQFGTKCSVYKKSLKCKPCKKYRQMVNKEARKTIRAAKLKKMYIMSKKTENILLRHQKKCDTCKNKHTTKCDLKDYIEYSGASEC